jgi:Predicted membrane protein (DUF2232)
MWQILPISLGAGAAAALLFASVASSSLFSIFLFYLSPLPIMIAALGWSQWAGLIGVAFAAAALAVMFEPVFFIAFLIIIGLPAWWLGYLALLARPATNAGAEALEWYPVGRLMIWAAVLATLMIVVAIAAFGGSEDSFRADLRSGLERILRLQTRASAQAPLVIRDIKDPGRLLDFLVMAIPPAAVVIATVTNLANLWLAGRIVHLSGRLRRPWPALPAITLPAFTSALLAAAAAASFVPGLTRMLATAFAAALLMVYALVGFAVLHAITRGMDSRRIVLAGVYSAVVVFGWPALMMTLLGLADAFIDIRGRFGRRGSPPAAPS